MKRRFLKAFAWWLAIMATLFICHASARLREASESSFVFKVDERPAPFSLLLRYAFYVYEPASYSACINNLRQIDGAKQQWALETKASPDAIPTWTDITPYLGRDSAGTRPFCPHGGIYTIGTVSNAPTCSIKTHVLP